MTGVCFFCSGRWVGLGWIGWKSLSLSRVKDGGRRIAAAGTVFQSLMRNFLFL